MNATPTDPVYFLLVDDLEDNLLALDGVLRSDEVVLLKARSGPEALELLLKYEVALAFIDVQMPVMDGFELAELMRGTERTRRVPIIFLTAGNADWQRRFRGYEAGAVDFLHKPLEPHVLRSKADVFFELYRQRREVARQRDELKAATEENLKLLNESRRTSKALEEADRRKDEFLAMLAHELRNPLAAIGNAVQVSKKTASQEHHEWATQVIVGQVRNLSRLIDDLMDISRITRGKIQLKTRVLDVKPVIEHAVHSVTSLIRAREHELSVEYGHGDAQVEVDPTRLEQVVANLLSNAAKYSEDKASIRLSTTVAGGELLIRVKDTGVGIPPEQLASMFDLFVQGDHSMARSEGGLGIGLTLVRRLVEMHGGSIVAESQGTGQGSTFTVRLPLAKSIPIVDRGDQRAEVQDQAAVTAKHRILVVDDHVDTVLGFSRLLTLMGHDVQIAHDGKEALAIVDRFLPDFILMDIGLPGLDGYQVAARLRELECCQKTVIVAISGYGQEEDRRRSREAGFNHHLIKPLDYDALVLILSGGK
ncbi:response regulator [Singulisphaera sp. Ch08]|uniref:histidine kinase n=1 Tax=Singulisphaera sp. Ch08 TaxID=3120278 RepID=A0AAU7CIY2_9BACT